MAVINIVSTPSALDYPLTHARIGYQTITRAGTASASTAATGYPADAPTRPDTYERWKPTALPATWTFDAGSAQSVNYIGIAAHTLGTTFAAVTLQYSADNINWTNYGNEFTPSDDAPILVLGDAVSARYWRVSIASATGIPEIGVVYIGTALEMPRLIFAGAAPIALSRDTKIRPASSEGGQFIGRTIIRRGVTGSADFKHLPNAWYRTYFDPFVKAAREYPFFFAWRPSTYPDEVAYVTVDKDIRPSHMGQGPGWLQVGFSMIGYADEE